MKKKELALLLSQLETFATPNVELEQYQTEGELAADILWQIFLQGNIEEKVIADLGCGNGILGIGALLLGAKKVHFVDVDEQAIALAEKNLHFVQEKCDLSLSATFYHMDVQQFTKKLDVVLENPPFGVQQPHADRHFLLAAMKIAPVIYSFHKLDSKGFITELTKDHGYQVVQMFERTFTLKQTQEFHTKRVYPVEIGIWQIETFKNNP